MNFKEMVVLKIEEQRAAMSEINRGTDGRDLTQKEKLSFHCHSELVVSLENALGNMDWLEKYGS